MANLKNVQLTLKLTFGILPIVAGLDKFTNLLTHWVDYLNPGIKAMLPFDPMVFMEIVGIIEIIAGIIVLIRPVVGGYIVAIWLLCIVLQLIAGGLYLDVAARDLVMAISAYMLVKLTKIVDGRQTA